MNNDYGWRFMNSLKNMGVIEKNCDCFFILEYIDLKTYFSPVAKTPNSQNLIGPHILKLFLI